MTIKRPNKRIKDVVTGEETVAPFDDQEFDEYVRTLEQETVQNVENPTV